MPRELMRTLVIAGAALLAGAAVHAPVAFAADAAPGVIAQSDGITRSVKVGLNKSLVLDLPRQARDILVSNPDIADAVIRTPTRIYVTGVKVGQSNVIVFDRAGQRIVSLDLEVERDVSTLASMLQRLIPDSNINVEIVSDNIVLTGTVKNASDSQKAQDIATAFANGGAQAQPTGGSTSTTGASTAGSVSISLGASTPTSAIMNMLTIEGEDQVHLKITVAEVQRNVAKQFGVTFGGNVSIGAFNSCITNPTDCTTLGNPYGVANKPGSDNAIKLGFTSGNSSIAATIRALEQTGMLKTLAEPTLTAISGENASFLAGGEFPVPTSRDSDGNVTVTFKPFGVALAFTPVVLSEGRISLHVKTEVSELTSQGAFTLNGGSSGASLSIPGLKVRRAESTLELPSGGSMVLGGLMEDSVRESIAALPGLGKLPVLGALFRSRDFQRDQTELVIIVTPYLVKPVPRSALSTPDAGFIPATDGQAVFMGDINRVYGGPGTKSKTNGQYQGRYGFIYE